MANKRRDYFAVDASLDDLKAKIDEYYRQLTYVGYEKKFLKSYQYYFGYGYNARSDSLIASGDRGEETRMMVNTYRNLLRYQLSLVTSERPAFDVIPINTDYDSMASAIVGDEVLEYYLRSKKLESYLVDAAEKAIYSSEGYLALQWDTKAGDFYGVDPESQKPIPQGDIKFSTYNMASVIRDLSFNPHDSNWLILTDVVNKFDLAERFPEFTDEILDLGYSYKPTSLIDPRAFSDDSCILYTFYHKRTPSMPEGKMVLFTEQTKLLDIVLPYPSLPVYRISPANLDGTNLGYTDAFDILGLQEALDELHSSVVTNNINHSKQCIVAPKDADFNYRDLVDGATLIEANEDVIDKIRALQLTQSSPETYNLLDRIEGQMEKKTGINEVIRGDPSSNLRSGNALALIAAQSIKYNSPLQQSYARLLEDAGTAVLQFLQIFATTPRFAEVVGKNNRTFLKSFDQTTLTGVSKVTAELSNPLSKTAAGRVQIAENLLQNGMIKRPEQYISVLDTGKLDPILESERTEMLNIRAENEELQAGRPPPAIITDTHALHIREHRSVLDDPGARKDPKVVEAALAHLEEHERLWQEVSMRPALLQATQQQPAPPGPQQGGPGNSQVMQGQQQAPPPGMPSLPNVPPAASMEDQAAFEQLNLQQ